MVQNGQISDFHGLLTLTLDTFFSCLIEDF